MNLTKIRYNNKGTPHYTRLGRNILFYSILSRREESQRKQGRAGGIQLNASAACISYSYLKGRHIISRKQKDREREIRYFINNLLLVDKELGALVNICGAGVTANGDREHEVEIFVHWYYQPTQPRKRFLVCRIYSRRYTFASGGEAGMTNLQYFLTGDIHL